MAKKIKEEVYTFESIAAELRGRESKTIDFKSVKIIDQYQNKAGDFFTRFKVKTKQGEDIPGTFLEIINCGKEGEPEQRRSVPAIKKITKADRVVRIKILIAQNLSRHEVKDMMYKEQFYFNNPNPASAFAGDWNSIQ